MEEDEMYGIGLLFFSQPDGKVVAAGKNNMGPICVGRYYT